VGDLAVANVIDLIHSAVEGSAVPLTGGVDQSDGVFIVGDDVVDCLASISQRRPCSSMWASNAALPTIGFIPTDLPSFDVFVDALA
jgi:hypothetical protein